MFSLRGSRALASVPVFWALVVSHVSAEEAARGTIAKLLEVGWSISPQARAAADLQYEEVVRVAGGDPRAFTASWLVLMQQRRYDDALKRLDEHLAKHSDDVHALRARTWVLTVLKNYPAAMIAADQLSALVADRPPADADRETHDELIAFLGRLAGYLGGPAATAVNQDERKALERKLLERLDGTRRAMFEDARNGVLSKFILMSDDSAAAQERALATANAEKAKTLAEVQADREKSNLRSRELDDRKNKVRDDFRDELDAITKQDQPLVQELTRLSSRASVLNGDLAAYAASIARLQQLAAGEKDPVRKQQYLLEADQLALLASRIEADLVAVNRLARGVQAQRAALAARQAQAQSNAAAQTQRIDRELADLAKRERRNDGIEKRAARPASGSTSRVLSLSAQATALSTYDPYPLEAAKTRLLESLR